LTIDNLKDLDYSDETVPDFAVRFMEGYEGEFKFFFDKLVGANKE